MGNLDTWDARAMFAVSFSFSSDLLIESCLFHFGLLMLISHSLCGVANTYLHSGLSRVTLVYDPARHSIPGAPVLLMGIRLGGVGREKQSRKEKEIR